MPYGQIKFRQILFMPQILTDTAYGAMLKFISKYRNANGSKALPDNRRQSKWLKTARITAKAAPKIAANVQKKVFLKNLTK